MRLQRFGSWRGDIGTVKESFQIDCDNNGPILTHNSGVLELDQPLNIKDVICQTGVKITVTYAKTGTATVTDGGGGTLNFYSPGHTMVTSNLINIYDSTNYNNASMPVTVVDADNFKITAAYVEDENDVRWVHDERVDIKVPDGTGGLQIYSGNYSQFLLRLINALGNVTVGAGAGRLLASGAGNTMVGYGAADLETDGSCGAYGGYYAGAQGEHVQNFAGWGYMVGYLNNGNNFSGLGHKAGYACVSGNGLFLGNQAGEAETSGNRLYMAISNTTTPLIYGEFDTQQLTLHAIKVTQSSATGGGLQDCFSEETVTLSGASSTIQVNLPAGAKRKGLQLRVDTEITSGDGATSWSAAFSGGASDTICTGQAFTKDTKVDALFDDYVSSPLVSAETDITITPNSGTFSGGVVRAIVYYEALKALGDAA